LAFDTRRPNGLTFSNEEFVMKCPVCKEAVLMMSQRNNIEIDYCPQCRGVWLDRGELDKIIEHALAQDDAAQQPARQAEPYPPPPGYPPSSPPDYAAHHKHHHDKHYHGDAHYRKRKQWWSDMFDFD
jgi:uncharacterized protein